MELAATIATIISAATTTGVTLEQALNQPSTPKLPTSTATSPLTAPQNQAVTASVAQALPDWQAQTSGLASPSSAGQFATTQAGVANNPQASGDIQAALNSFFGFGTSPQSGLSGVTPVQGSNPIIDLLSKGKPATGTGGDSGAGSDFVNSILSGDTFRGLAG